MPKHTQREKSGQGLVEFALILPLLLLLLVGVFEFGRLLFIYSNLYNATREGIRYGVTNPRDFDGIHDAVASRVVLAPVNPIDDPFNPEGVWIIVQYDNGPGTPKHQDVDYLSTGDRVFVNVMYNIKAMTPLFDPIFSIDGINLNSKATRTIQTVGLIVNPPPTAPPGYGEGGGGEGGGGGPDPTITLAPTCGAAGAQSISINGYGWDGDSRIDAYFDDTQISNNAAINPIFILPFDINNVQEGTHTVSVTGRQTGRTATATYMVPCDTNTPTPTPTNTPTPIPTSTSTPTPTPTGVPTLPPTPAPASIVIDKPVPADQTFVAGSAQPRETVTLRIIQTGVLVSVVVGDDGRFLFADLPPLQAGTALIVQGYGQQDMAVVGDEAPTPEPTSVPRQGGYIEIAPKCGQVGDQTITVNLNNWPSGYLTIHFGETEVYNSGNKKRSGTFAETFSVSNVAAGDHTVTARAWDKQSPYRDLLFEYAVTFTSPCPVPDLVVNQMQLSTQPPLGTYQKIDVEVQVTNQGGADIPSLFWVDLFADTPSDPYTYSSVDYVAINGLPAGASIDFTMWVEAGFATTGDHTLIVLADTWNQVLESNETNNTDTPLTVTVTITNPVPTPTPTPAVTPGPKGNISGITYMDGVPQSLANIYVYDSSGRLIWSGFSRSITTPSGGTIDGYYEAELPAGDYTVVGQMRMATALYWGQVIVTNLQPGETRQEVDINLTALE